MSPLLTSLLVVLLFAALTLGWLWSVSSRLQGYRVQCSRALIEMIGQLRARCSLVPRLVETARDAKTEASTSPDVVALRARAIELSDRVVSSCDDATKPGTDTAAWASEIDVADRELEMVLSRIRVDPETSAGSSGDLLRRLVDELRSVETKLAFARTSYNDAVTEYNAVLGELSVRWFASSLGFRELPLLTKPEEVSIGLDG